MDQPWGRACGVLWPVVFVTGVIANHNDWMSGYLGIMMNISFSVLMTHMVTNTESVVYDITGMTHMVNTVKKRGL